MKEKTMIDRWKVETRFTDEKTQTLTFPFESEARAYHSAVLMARECVLSKLMRVDPSTSTSAS